MINITEIENSNMIKLVLNSLINISSRKTSMSYAVSKVDDLIKKFQTKYDFLKNVNIKDTRFQEFEDPISVMSEINSVNSKELGNALYDIIKNMNITLGKDAGHFFIKELRNNIGTDYITKMEDIGLDLGLMQLEFEVSEMTKKLDKS